MNIRFEETGEIRCPLEGEFFKEPNGFVNQAIFNFSVLKFSIMRMILKKEEGDEDK